MSPARERDRDRERGGGENQDFYVISREGYYRLNFPAASGCLVISTTYYPLLPMFQQKEERDRERERENEAILLHDF